MKLLLADVDYNSEIFFEEGFVLSIECESKEYFAKLIENAKGLNLNHFKIVSNEKVVDVEKELLTIIDYYSIESYEKTILTKFYKTLDKTYVSDEEVIIKMKKISEEFSRLAKYVVEDLNADFEINMPTLISDYLKFSGLKMVGGFEFGFEGTLNFINLCSALKLYKVLVLVNAKSFFNDNQMEEIIKCLTYNKQKTLFIDSTISKKIYKNEIKLYIDSDFYDILYR